MTDNQQIDLDIWGLLRWAGIAGILIYQYVLIIDLRARVDNIEQAKTAFYLVESTTGRQLKLGQIK